MEIKKKFFIGIWRILVDLKRYCAFYIISVCVDFWFKISAPKWLLLSGRLRPGSVKVV